MHKKNLILVSILILAVFLSASAVSAENSSIIDDKLTNSTSTEVTVQTTDTNDQIQEKINSLSDGDTLTFEKGDYNDICLYVNATSITINGNGATLHGLNNLTTKDLGEVIDGTYIPGRIPEIISNKTTEGGYGISNPATLYILKTNNLVINNLNIVAGTNSGTDKGADTLRYSNCLVYNYQSTNTQIINSTFEGSTWGIYFYQSTGGLIENNKVKNQGVTGIFNFQTPNTIIRGNTITNAKNHGIDVRHMVGPNVKVLDNKIVGSKEGIYLLHSGKHTVTGNTIINCSLSSITCCGANNILIENNNLQNSRIGVLLSGSAPVGGTYVGYSNITIGNNQWKLDTLPFPPSFTFYVAEAKSDYATVNTMMGTHSDSLYGDTYTEYTGIEEPSPIEVDYDTILKPTTTTKTITSGMTSAEIQETINSMNNGDTLIFEENAVFEDVCIYIDKNIKVIGNNATLKGVNSVSYDYVPEIVTNRTSAGGYAIPNIAVLYVLNTTNAVISNLNIVAKYPGYTMPCQPGTENYNAYYTTGIYGGLSKNLVITGCTITGASWGIFLGGRPDGDYKYGCQNVIITKNTVKNQYTTGIMNFASPNSIIANNTVTNAKNHGIDVRFPAGFGAKVFNNTISGSKEGIYLLHSYGHYVYDNIISNCKISSITCYGSHDEYIYNNTLSKSRIAILLGGSSQNSFYNVTIGPNTFDGDKLPFPPTFAFTLAKTEDKYNDATGVMRTYSDKEIVTILANDVETMPNEGQFNVTLIDQNGKVITNKEISISIGSEIYDVRTNSEGIASINLSLTEGKYTAIINSEKTDNYAKATANATITVKQPKADIDISAVYNSANKEIIATLTNNATGKAIANAKVQVDINGETTTAKTNTKGKAVISTADLPTDTYTATISYAGNSKYNPASTNITFTTKADIIISDIYGNSHELTATLINGATGKAISGASVVVDINGVSTTVKSNSKGQIKADVPELSGGDTYTATISYKGNAKYNAASASAAIELTKTNMVITAKYDNSNNQIVATVTNADTGKAVTNTNVKVSLNGVTTTVKSNSKGQAIVSTANLAPGTYIAILSYQGNAKYNPVSTTATAIITS